ncbi:hypothetical protein [Pedobacter sp.]|uniref:hypothetical protein n=1 Tax=Pedobacter sp. TaxID=1411316 RepID=UPI003BADBA18
MKNTFTLFFAITIFGCNIGSSQKHGDSFAGDQNSSQQQQQQPSDTVLVVQEIAKEISGEGRIEKEYFLAKASDSSSFSCIVQQKTCKKALSMLLRYAPGGKIPAKISQRDTNALVSNNGSGKTVRELSLKDQLQELRFILQGISKEYDFDSLKYIRMSIGTFRQLSVDLTKEFTAKYGKRVDYKSNEKVRQLLLQSTFSSQLNQILKYYGITVIKVSLGELVYYLPPQGNLDTRPGARDTTPEKIIDGLAVFTVSGGK